MASADTTVGGSSTIRSQEDEVTELLKFFQSKPDFLLRRKRDKQSVRIRYKKGDAVTHNNQSPMVELLVLHTHISRDDDRMILRLKFRVSTDKPHICTYVEWGSSKASTLVQVDEKLGQVMNDLCETVSQYTKTRIEKMSLFSVVSKLLAALNGKIISDRLTELQQFMSQSNPPVGARNRKQQVHLIPFESKLGDCMDLGLFLMRCAATSKSSKTTMVTPVPPSDFWHRAMNSGLTAAMVMVVTNESIINPVAASAHAPSTDSSTRQYEIHCARKEIHGYLSCLPWSLDGQLSTQSSTQSLKGGTKIRVSLAMDNAIGDDSPRFERLANDRGVTTAYHGTKLDAVWSILNHGLLNLSETKQCQHGAMLGSGVYASPSLQVAEFFSKSTELHPSVFWQWYQGRSLRSSSKDRTTIPWLESLPISALNEFTVSCRAVVQVRLILPPTRPSSPSKNREVRKDTTSEDFHGGTRLDGKYYVVPNDQDIQITKIYLTFEFQKKRSKLLVVLVFGFLVLLNVLLKRTLSE